MEGSALTGSPLCTARSGSRGRERWMACAKSETTRAVEKKCRVRRKGLFPFWPTSLLGMPDDLRAISRIACRRRSSELRGQCVFADDHERRKLAVSLSPRPWIKQEKAGLRMFMTTSRLGPLRCLPRREEARSPFSPTASPFPLLRRQSVTRLRTTKEGETRRRGPLHVAVAEVPKARPLQSVDMQASALRAGRPSWLSLATSVAVGFLLANVEGEFH